MCVNLVKICKYLGQHLTEEIILPELVELIDDEENEVKVIAFQTYIKCIRKVFSNDYLKTQKNDKVVKKILKEFQNEMCTSEIKLLVSRKLNTIISFTQDSNDSELTDLFYEVLK